MKTIEERVAEIERRLDRMEPHVNRTIPLGPREKTREEISQDMQALTDILMEGIKRGS